MTVAPRTTAEFVEWFVARHPPLAPILEEHLNDNFRELLPHMLFGDVTRYAADLARRAAEDPEANDSLRRLLEDLDAAMLPNGDDDPVDNLIWVSFVENAQGRPGDPEEALRPIAFVSEPGAGSQPLRVRRWSRRGEVRAWSCS